MRQIKKIHIIIFFAALIAEVFVFNLRHWQSIGYKPVSAFDYPLGVGEGMEVLPNGEFYLAPECARVLEFSDINRKIHNVYIDVYDKRCEDVRPGDLSLTNDFQSMNVNVYITDRGNKRPYKLPARVIASGVPRTRFITLQTYGQSSKFKLEFGEDLEGQTVVVRNVVFDLPVPFCFVAARFVLLLAVMYAVYILRRGSWIYNIQMKWDRRQKLISAGCMLFTFLLCTFVWLSVPRYHRIDNNEEYLYGRKGLVGAEGVAYRQYDELAQSFMEGKLYIREEPPSFIAEMENPYDNYERSRIVRERGVSWAWDHAYYNGKYYVYFGALPVLVYYLPYRLVTGVRFHTDMGVLINVFIFILCAFLLIKDIILRWFKNIPFITYLMLSNVLVFSSQLIFALKKPDLYFMPITMAIMLVTAGLDLWMSGNKTAKIAFGSLFMALVAACRPQFLAASFLAIPLFWDDVFKQRTMFSKSSVKRTLAFVLPYVVVAAGVMWYNRARFGSVFDFGANYNLTTNDMTSRGFKIDRLPLGIFAYFFKLPVTTSVFPYITYENLQTDYQGVTICESMFGGIFITQPILWLCMKLRSVKESLMRRKLYAFTLCALLLMFIVALADTQMAGVLNRYYLDFSYLAVIAAVIIALALCEENKNAAYTAAVLSGGCFIWTFLMFFVAVDPLDYPVTFPNIYYSMASALMFWM